MTQDSTVLQSLETFSDDVNQALHTNLLSFSETEAIGAALCVIQARLNVHRNTFTPINKLPPEVLGRIFEFIVAPEPELFEDLSNLSFPSTPPRLTHWYDNLILVCTWWSKVATRCPRMWYHIADDDRAKRAPRKYMTRYYPRAVLRRSGHATRLHLYMKMPPQPASESVPWWVIKNQPARVDALHISLGDARTQSEPFLESLTTSLPSLRLLTIDAGSSFNGHFIRQDMPIIFGGEVLNLQGLICSTGIPFLPGNKFPSLAHLNLHELNSTFHDIRGLDSILRLLSNCPRLETLVFSQSSLDVVRGMGPERKPVRLDRLRALWVNGQYLEVNSALTFLSYLDLPPDATVRLSDLSELDPYNRSEPTEPPTSLPFLAQIDHPARLDIVHCEGGERDDGEIHAFHFIVVGPRSRFWLHLPGNSSVALRYLALLYKMLPKESVETVRFSVVTMRSFTFLPIVLGHLPSLTTLLVRHSNPSSPAVANAGIIALAGALRPRRHSVSDTPREESESDTGGSSEHGPFKKDPADEDGESGWESADNAEQGDPPDPPEDDTEQPLDAPTARLDPHGTSSSVEAVRSVPAPNLKAIGLELTCAPTMSLAPLIGVLEERKLCSHPIAAVQHKMVGVDMTDVDAMKGHVTEGLSRVDGKLWIPTIDEGWRVKNDYWRLHPTPWDDYGGWGISMEGW